MNKIIETPIPELYSELVVSPLYVIQLVLFIGWLIYVRKEKGYILLFGRFFTVFLIINYIAALYFRFFY